MATRRRKGPASGGGTRKPRVLPAGRDFWGRDFDDEDLPAAIHSIPEPSTMVKSLGPPPLHGHERLADPYFTAIYDKAANLANALAATAGMLAFGTDDETDSGR